MKKKTTIALLLQNLEGGGAERVALNIINNIDLKKFFVKVIFLENRGVYLKQLKNREGLEIVTFNNYFKKYRYINFILNYIKALNYLKQREIKIVFSQYNPGKILGFFKFLFKDKKIIYRETNIPEAELIKSSLFYKIIYQVFYNYGIFNYDKIITQSNDMRDNLIRINRKIGRKPIILINNFIDNNMINEKIKEKCKEKVFNNNSIKLVSVGRLDYQKGYDLIINTLSKLIDLNFEFIIIGEGIERENLTKIINEKKLKERVRLIGFRENPYMYIKQADFFISSSRFEGFPNAVIEALACGVPVIANDYQGGINEIIKNGQNGEILDITDEDSLKKTLNKSYNSEFIIKDVSNRYGKDRILKKYEKLFLSEENF